MPDLTALTGSLLLILLLVFLLWFAFGTQRNIRRGNDILRWLQDGLPLLAGRTRLRWLGSTAAVLDLVDPGRPFKEAQVVVVLEPRDLSFLWAWSRARRRRDFIILRGRMHRSPSLELEAGNAMGWTGQDRLRKLDPESWDRSSWGDPLIGVAQSPGADSEAVRRLWDELARCTGGVWRLSIRREPPHLEVHVLPPDTEAVSADRLLRTFRELAETIMSPL